MKCVLLNHCVFNCRENSDSISCRQYRSLKRAHTHDQQQGPSHWAVSVVASVEYQ